MRKAFLVLPGYCVGVGGLLLITYRTFSAISSGRSTVIVHVNRYGEQYLDLACLVFLWVVCLVGLWSLSSLLPGKKRIVTSSPANPDAISDTRRVSSADSSSFVSQSDAAAHEQAVPILFATNREFLQMDDTGCVGLYSVMIPLRQEDSLEEKKFSEKNINTDKSTAHS